MSRLPKRTIWGIAIATVAVIAIVSIVRIAMSAVGFTNVTSSAGLGSVTTGYGIALGDYNNDGYVDFVAQGHTVVYENNGNGTFTATSSITQNGRATHWGDYDNDGDLDYGATWDMYLQKNNGNETFTLQTNATIGISNINNLGDFCWLDYDRDGDLDIFAPNGGSPYMVIYSNDGDSTFTQVTGSTIGLNASVNGETAIVGDYNWDGYTDMIHRGGPFFMWKNNGNNTFTDVSSTIGISVPDDAAGGYVGTGFGDYNNDGHPDLYIGQAGANYLYSNDGDGTFTNVTSTAGVGAGTLTTRGVDWGDFDHDGDLDLYVGHSNGANNLFSNNGNGTFTDVAATYGVNDSSATYGVIWADYDNDGDLDLFVGNASAVTKLFRNDLNDTNYLKVKCTGIGAGGSPKDGTGTRVELYDSTGTTLRAVREIFGGQSYGSHSPAMAHFGLASAWGGGSGTYVVKVKFTSGTVKTLTGVVPTSESITIGATTVPQTIQVFEGNNRPNAPQTPYCEGAANPTGVTDTTPEFSAIFDDTETSNTATYYEIEVDTASAFNGTRMWDTGKTVLTPALAENIRSTDVSYAGTALSLNGATYYWRIRFWDNSDAQGTWSTTQQFTMASNVAPSAPQTPYCEGSLTPVTGVTDLTPEFSAIYDDANTSDTATYYEIEVSTVAPGTDWWNVNYGYRQPLTISATDAVDAGYSVKTTINTAALETAGKVRPDRNDWRVVYAPSDSLRSLSFNGSEDCYVNIPDSANLDISDAVTIEAWVETTNAAPFGTSANPGLSAQHILNNAGGATNGVYWIDPDGSGGSAAVQVYCDMATDGGGWTMVASTAGTPLNDQAGSYYSDLQTLSPAAGHLSIWDGMRPLADGDIGSSSQDEIRFSAKTPISQSSFDVDLSFHIGWYYEITSSTSDASVGFEEADGAGDTQPPPERTNILTGVTLPQGDQWNAYGYLEGEDSAGDTADFTVDFDDRGMDSNESDGTDWGGDDGVLKCGTSGVSTDTAWFIWFKEDSTKTSGGITKPDAYGIAFSNTTLVGRINNKVISASLSTGWNHVAITYDKNAASNQLKLYINGTLAAQDTLTESINVNTKDLNIGKYFNGKIDEVRISNNVRYSSSFTPQTTPFTADANTVLLQHLDEGSGIGALDSSGLGNHGKLGNINNVYYVRKTGSDSNSGLSAGSAWLTIGKAASTMVAGDVVYVGAGTYQEMVQPANSGTAGKRIYYIADTGGAYTGDAGAVIIDGQNTRARSFELSSDNYIVIEGFEHYNVLNDGGGGANILASNSNNLIIRNNIFRDTGRDGIGLGSSTNCLVENNLIYNIVDDGITPGTNNTYRNNTIYNCGGTGFEGAAGAGLVYENNIIWDAMDSTILATANYNDYIGSVLSGTGNISSDPLFINAAGGNFHLSHTAAGQGSNSPCIDAGGVTASSLQLNKRSTRSDNVLDSGTVDLGYHYRVSQDYSNWPIHSTDGKVSTTREIDRDYVGTSETWFKLQAPIAAAGSDGNYFAYYSYSGETSSPASDLDNVYLFADNFSSSLDTTKWATTTGAPATSAGKLVLDAAEGVMASGFSIPIATIWESSADPQATTRDGSGLRAATTSGNGFVQDGYLGIVDILWWNSGTWYAEWDGGELGIGSYASGFKTYKITYRKNGVDQIIYDYNNGAATSIHNGNAVTGIYPVLYSYNGQSQIDYLKIRKYVNTEPTTTPGSEQASGGDMWDTGKTALTPALAENTRSTDVSYAGTALSFNGATYYWRIRFWDNSDAQGAWSTTQQFTMSTTQLPSAPSSLSPATGAWTNDNTPTLSFTQSDPDVGDTVKYRIQVDDTVDFSSVVVDYTSALIAQGATSFTVGQVAGTGTYTVGSAGQTLSDSANYYWRVMSTDNNAASSSWATANAGAIAFKVDTVAPTITSPTITETSAYLYLSGTTLYYSDGMGVTAQNADFNGTASDATSGLNQATFSTAFGDSPAADATPATWSGVYTVVAADTGAQTLTVTISDNAGNTATATLNGIEDITVPTITSPTITETSSYLYLSGTTLYYSDGMGVTAQNADFNGTSSDGGSGLYQATFSTAFSDSPAADATPATWSGVYTVVAVDTGAQTLTVTVSDNVGNSATSTINGVEDITSPTITSPTITETSAYLYLSGTNLYYSDGMGITAQNADFNGSSSDAGAGLTQATFSTAFGDSPVADATPATWSGVYTVVATDIGAQTLTVTISDNVGNTAVSTINGVEDITSPTITSPTITETSSYLYLSGTTLYYSDGMAATPQNADFNGTSSDAGSGLTQATFSTAFGDSPVADATPATWSGVYTVVQADTGAQALTVTISDNVGNTAVSTINGVEDITSPTITSPTITETSSYLYLSGTTLYYSDGMGVTAQNADFNGTSSDAGADLYQATFSTAFGDSPAADATPATWSGVYTIVAADTGAQTLTVTVSDNVGNTAVSTINGVEDTTGPTISSPTITETSAYLYLSGTNLYYSDGMGVTAQNADFNGTSSDAGSGLTQATFSTAFGDSPSADATPGTWSGVYTVVASDTGAQSLTVTVSDNVGNTAVSTINGVEDVAVSVPGNLTFNSKTATSVVLNFGAQITETIFDTYKIFYKLGVSGVTEANTQHVDANLGYINYNAAASTTISSLTTNNYYTFNIWAYDLAGNKASATEITVFVGACTLTSAAVDFDDGAGLGGLHWGQISWNDTETSGSIKYQVEYYTGSGWALIPDVALAGNSSGFTTSPIDISSLNTTTYNQIRLKAIFTYSSGTPILSDWTVTWMKDVEVDQADWIPADATLNPGAASTIAYRVEWTGTETLAPNSDIDYVQAIRNGVVDGTTQDNANSTISITTQSTLGPHTYHPKIVTTAGGTFDLTGVTSDITVDHVKITGITFSGGTPSGGNLITGRYWFKSNTGVNINIAAVLDYGTSAITGGKAYVGHSLNSTAFADSGLFSAGTAVKNRLENCPGTTITYDDITVGYVTEGGNNSYGQAVNLNGQNTKDMGWDGVLPTPGTVAWQESGQVSPYVWISGTTLYYQSQGSTIVHLVVTGASDNLGSVEYDFPYTLGTDPARGASNTATYTIDVTDSGGGNAACVVYDPVENLATTNYIMVEHVTTQAAPTGVACDTISGGTAITAITWQQDDDPYVYWTAPAAGPGIAEYEYKVNNAVSEAPQINPTSTGANAYVQLVNDVLPDGKWKIRVRARNNVSMWSVWSDPFEIWVDDTPPSGVGSFSYGTVTDTAISVSVSGASDTTSGLPANCYYIECDYGATSFSVADANSGWCSGTWDLSTLSVGTAYAFRWKVKDNAGNETAWQTPSPAYKYTLPAAPDAVCNKTVSTWYQGKSSAEQFNFTSANLNAGTIGYYRYVLDVSPSTNVTVSGTQWLSGTLAISPLTSKNMYLHVRAYSSDGGEGSQADYGPYYFVDTSRLLKHKKFFDDDGQLKYYGQ